MHNECRNAEWQNVLLPIAAAHCCCRQGQEFRFFEQASKGYGLLSKQVMVDQMQKYGRKIEDFKQD